MGIEVSEEQLPNSDKISSKFDISQAIQCFNLTLFECLLSTRYCSRNGKY